MKGGSCMKFLPVLLLSAFVYAQTPKIPRMADGHPDLQGFWNNASLTPLERPVALGDKQVFTAEEAAAFERNRLQEVNRDRRDGGTQADAARATHRQNEGPTELGVVIGIQLLNQGELFRRAIGQTSFGLLVRRFGSQGFADHGFARQLRVGANQSQLGLTTCRIQHLRHGVFQMIHR